MCDQKYHPSLTELIQAVDYERYRNIKKLKNLSQQLLEESEKLNDKFGEVFALNHLGLAYATLQDSQTTYELTMRALPIAKALNCPRQLGQILNSLIWFYEQTGQIEKAIETNYEIRKIAEKHNDYTLLCDVITNEAVLEFAVHQTDFETRRNNFLKVIEYSQRYDVNLPMSISLLNLSVLYLHKGEFEEALRYAEQGYQEALETDYIYGQICALLNLCTISAKTNKFNEAHDVAWQAHELAVQYDLMVHETLGYIGLVYNQQQAYPQAIQYFKQSEARAIEQDDKTWLVEIRKELMDVYEQTEDYQNALYYTQKYYETREEVYDDKSKLRVQMLKHEYEEQERVKNLKLKARQDLADAKQQILTRITHEFRTPLTVIQTSVQMLDRYRDRLDGEQHEKHTARVYTQIETIVSLLDDILEVLRDPTDYTEKTVDNHNLNVLIQIAVNIAYQKLHLVKDSRIHVLNDVDYIKTDDHLFQQIIIQLLINALKFSDEDIHVTVQKDSEGIKLTVADTGIGIPKDEQEQVFQMLVRGTNINELRGNGLGLAIVKNYVDLLGGTITLDSVEGEYTTITITLPQ